MLENMGWSSGKGLGAQEQGMVEHIRVRVKNDQIGELNVLNLSYEYQDLIDLLNMYIFKALDSLRIAMISGTNIRMDSIIFCRICRKKRFRMTRIRKTRINY